LRFLDVIGSQHNMAVHNLILRIQMLLIPRPKTLDPRPKTQDQ
jgi:hypothetical protein